MATIDIVRPLVRNQGVQIPGVVNAANWCDAVVLAANTAETYTLPTDASGNKAHIIGITGVGGSPVYANFDTTAVIPVADTTDGSAPALLRTDLGHSYIVSVPAGTVGISFISAAVHTLIIECWN